MNGEAWKDLQGKMQSNADIEMQDPYYGAGRAPGGHMQEYDSRQQSNYVKLYRPEEQTSSFSSVPMGEVITEQPMQSYGSQISTGMSSGFGGRGSAGGGASGSGQGMPGGLQMMQAQVGIPLPGLEILEGIPSFKIHTQGLLEGHTSCSPGYKVFNLQGEIMLNGTSDTLFCPFDSKQKNIYLKDSNEDCVFQVKFTPSVCECDSEEKRCFAVFSPVFENPFGAILFEAGQLKYSMKILNALEGETFAVQFLGSQDVSIKGADGSIVAIINIHRKRGEGQRYTLTFMEEVSVANKALFIGCAITLSLVTCESVCSRCICLTPVILACLAILGLSIGSITSSKGPKPG